MAYYPKEKSNAVLNMIAELNELTGRLGFSSTYQEETRTYSLNLNERVKSLLPHLKEAECEAKNYSDMINYLEGLIIGIKIGLKRKQPNV